MKTTVISEVPKFRINEEVQTPYAEYEWHAGVILHRWYDDTRDEFSGWWYLVQLTDKHGTYQAKRQEHEIHPLFVFVPMKRDSITALREFFASMS